MPAGFLSLYDLSGPALVNAISQVSGESTTGARIATAQLFSQYLTTMLDRTPDLLRVTGGGAQSFGGRVETGYRLDASVAEAAAYGALQAQAFSMPGFSEVDLNGGGLGLSYASKTSTDTRAEIGIRLERLQKLDSGGTLVLRARVAYAHDWTSNTTLLPTFLGLPGTGFSITGVVPAANSALLSAGAELRLAKGISLTAKYDGVLASGSNTNALTAGVRIEW